MSYTTPEQYLAEVPWIDRPDADIDNHPIEPGLALDEPALRALLHRWRRDGIVVLPGAADLASVDGFVQELDAVVANPHQAVLSIEIQGRQTWTLAEKPELMRSKSVKINHLHNASAWAARLSLCPAVVDFLKCIFDSPPTPTQSLTFWTGSEQATHIDYPYVKAQRRLPFMAASWVALEDVHIDAGPIEYFPGAHAPDAVGFFDWGQGNIVVDPKTRLRSATEFANFIDRRLAERRIEPVVYLPKKGDVLLWHCNMPHRGSAIRDANLTRKSYVTHYTGMDDYPLSWRLESGTERGRTLTHGGSTVFDFPWGKPEGKLRSWFQASGA
jgi:hypothetical protein